MINKRIASMALLSMAISFAVQSYAEEGESSSPIDATNTLPDAKPGECFAKVIIPAEYEIKTEEIVVQPGRETVDISPATFDTSEVEVEVRPEYTKLKAIAPTFRTEEESIEVEAARTEWVTALGKKGIPSSPALLVAAKTSGVDIDDADAGECFREYYTPAKFEQKEKQVKIKDESEIITIKDAEFEAGEEIVTVKDSYKVKKLIPAVYETVEEKVELEPAKAVWKKGAGPVERIDNSTGEIMCLVNIPAKYETFSKKVLKNKAEIEETEMPAETKVVKIQKLVTDATQEKSTVDAEYTSLVTREKVSDASFSWRNATEEGSGTYTGLQICLKEFPAINKIVKKQVLDKEASVEEEKIAAELKAIKTLKVATEAEVKRETSDPVMKTVEKRFKTTSEKLEWRRVLCKTNMTKDINMKIQRALKDAGYYNGTVDGNIGRGTMNSVNKYQQDKDLPRGGLTIKVLEELGIM